MVAEIKAQRLNLDDVRKQKCMNEVMRWVRQNGCPLVNLSGNRPF